MIRKLATVLTTAAFAAVTMAGPAAAAPPGAPQPHAVNVNIGGLVRNALIHIGCC